MFICNQVQNSDVDYFYPLRDKVIPRHLAKSRSHAIRNFRAVQSILNLTEVVLTSNFAAAKVPVMKCDAQSELCVLCLPGHDVFLYFSWECRLITWQRVLFGILIEGPIAGRNIPRKCVIADTKVNIHSGSMMHLLGVYITGLWLFHFQIGSVS